LTVEKKGKKNIFSGRVLEIEGLPQLKVEQAFELSDASAERSASGCSVKLDKEPIIEYMNSNIVMFKWMISEGYGDVRTITRRIDEMEAWLANPELLEADADAEYAEIIEIDLAEITEPLLACPNDPDDVKTLSAVAGQKIDEVFIGSCMTNIGHFRAAGKLLEKLESPVVTRLWIVPTHRRGLLQHLRPHRCAHRDAGLLAVHGQPGARRGKFNGGVDLDTQLSESSRQGRRRLPGIGGVGRGCVDPRQDPEF